ncbi:MAG: hypothetical protein ABR575_02270 [Actinomycetota bacterium]
MHTASAALTYWALSLVLLSGTGTAAPKAGPKTVWQDARGDATMNNQTPDLGAFGFDLTSGSIARDKRDLVFSITHAGMPPGGTLPEGFRFLWAFSVDGAVYRITAKSADVGKPDLLAGETTERVGRVDHSGHFRLESDCKQRPGVVVPLLNCKLLAYVEGAFDAAEGTISVTIPMRSLAARPGSVIGPIHERTPILCEVCWISHTAERSFDRTRIDSATVSSTWKVPR